MLYTCINCAERSKPTPDTKKIILLNFIAEGIRHRVLHLISADRDGVKALLGEDPWPKCKWPRSVRGCCQLVKCRFDSVAEPEPDVAEDALTGGSQIYPLPCSSAHLSQPLASPSPSYMHFQDVNLIFLSRPSPMFLTISYET